MDKHLTGPISLVIALTLTLCSCTALESDYPDYSKDTTKETAAVSVYSKEESETTEPVVSGSEDLSQIQYESDQSPEESSQQKEEPILPKRKTFLPDDSEITEIGSLIQLRDWLNKNKERDNLTVTFKYTGTTDLDGQIIVHMLPAVGIRSSKRKNKFTVKIFEYPGEKVVDAYFSGDDSNLSSDEKIVLEKAIQIVDKAKANTENSFDLELYLHDYLADTITYNDGPVDVPDFDDPPRHLTAVGALIDGSANCQGYTDGFYTLASIAGFQVSRMSVVNRDGEKHVFNTIKLDGKWYIVDTTHNDVADATNYQLFNAGKDMCQDYSWADSVEYHPIAEKSDGNYYYNNGDGKVFYDFDTMANSIMNRWLNGQTEFQTVIMGTVASWGDLSNVLQAKLDSTGRWYSYVIWTSSTDENTFFTVKFD